MPSSDDQVLWTLQLTGGEPFEFQAPGNPSMAHQGGVTVAHMVLRQVEVGELKLRAASLGASLRAWPMEGQSEEQQAERARFVGLGEEDNVWPCGACPSCPWFDPLLDDPCGLSALPPESVAVLLERPEHLRARAECPLRGSEDLQKG
jgi:hypothetical protein